MYLYDEAEMIEKLARSSGRALTAFALSCASRLLPAYRAYTQENGNVASGDFEAVLDDLWASVKGGVSFRPKVEESELAPVAEEYDLGFLASDAVASLIYASWVADDASPQSAAWAARRAYEAFDWAAQQRPTMPRDRFDEEALISDPLVQAELAEQAGDLDDILRNGDAIDFAAMEARAVGARANMEAALAVVIAARG